MPDHEALRHIVEAMTAMPGVTEVSARADTGSVLIRHIGSADDLLAGVADAGLIELVEPGEVPPFDPISAVSDGLSRADSAFKAATRAKIDLKSVAFTGLLVAALVQIARGKFAGPSLTLLSQAATIAMLNQSRRPPS